MKPMHYRILGITTVLAALSPEMAAALEKIGVVGLAGTTVTATGEDGQARTLKTGDDVYLNDRVVSDAGGKAQLIFLDRSTLTLNANTDLTLDTYVYDPATAGGTMSVSSVKGAFRFVGGALSKKQPVTIKTPVATIGIRGGIADTNVAPGTGASDAVFVYGDELTMTNQSGETFSVTQVGTGLMLDSPTGTPQPMPQSLVNQRMQSFGSPSPDSSDGSGSGEGGGTSGNSGGTGGGSSSNSSGSGSSGTAGGTADGGGGGPAGGAGAFRADTAEVGQTQNTETIKIAIIRGDEGVLPGITSLPQVNAGDTNPGTPTPPAAPPPAANPGTAGAETGTTGTNTGAGTTAGGSSSGGSAPPVPVLRGRYAHHDLSTAIGTRGTVATATDTRRAVFTENERRGGAVFIHEMATLTGGSEMQHPEGALPVPNYAGEGFVYLSLDTNADGTVDATMPGAYYESPGRAFKQYYFNDGGENLIFYQGLGVLTDNSALDSSMISQARTYSSGASATEGFEGVSFYSFMPDINQAPNSGYNYGLMDYRLPGSTVADQGALAASLGFAGTPGEHLRNGPGLMVDWQKGRFLTQNVEFVRNTADQSPGAYFAAGQVNNNGPHFLDGKAQHFEGETFNLAATSYTGSSASGTFRTGREIYANTNGRIEALVADVHATGKQMNVTANSIQTTAGSTSVFIIIPGHGLEVGDRIQMSGIAGNIDGIPASELNGAFIVAAVAGSQITIYTSTLATVGGVWGTGHIVQEAPQGSQAAVLDNSHGLNAADFIGRRSGAEMRGFAGGLIKKDTSGTINYSAHASGATKDAGGRIEDVRITPNSVTGSINSAHIQTHLRSGGGGPSEARGVFGGADSAYMNDTYYGAAQTSGTQNGEAVTVRNGFITTAHDDKTVSHCSSCQYTQWGVWASNSSNGTSDYAVQMMPYVAGRVTDATEFDAYRASVGNTGTANYTGHAYGSFHSSSNMVQNAQGAMNASVDLANREVSALSMNFGTVHGNNLTIETTAPMAIAPTGDAVFTSAPGAINVNWPATGSTSAVVHGALFGPQAQEIGGNFAIQHNEGMTLTGGGVFQGSR